MGQNDSDKMRDLFRRPEDMWKEDDYRPDANQKKQEAKGEGPKTHKQVGKRIATRIRLKKEACAQVLTERIEPGTSYHFISNGAFDYWNIVTRIIELHELTAAEFYGCTWTMNDANVKSLFELIDNRTLRSASVMVGLYFLHREPVVADTLKCGLEDRAQRFKACENHAKVVLLQAGEDWLVFEGSANFTANPRIEQFVLNNDRELFEFHKTWMNGYFEK